MKFPGLLVVFVIAACFFSPGALAQKPPYETKVLEVQGKVVDIVGVQRGIEGVLQDLGAKVTSREIVIDLATDVLFDFDKADLKPAATESLTKVAEVLRSAGQAPATIEGHTDGKGAADYNQKLSERRAIAVKDWLVKNGRIAASRLAAKGLGMKQPIVPNAKPDGSDDPDGRAKNRRVEIRIKRV